MVLQTKGIIQSVEFNVTMELWMAQGVGLLAFGINCVSFLTKTRESILGWQVLSAGLWSAHFFMLQADTAATMQLIGLLRQAVFLFRERYTWCASGLWPIIFSISFIVAGIATWSDWGSVLPVAGMVSGTIALWQVETWKLRLLSMIPPPLWFGYDALHHSFPAMASDAVGFVSQMIGFIIHEQPRRLVIAE